MECHLESLGLLLQNVIVTQRKGRILMALTRLKTTCTLLLVFLFSSLGASHAITLADIATKKFINNVVRISSVDKEGFGFVVGENGRGLYIATAAHVVYRNVGMPNETALPTTVIFMDNQREGDVSVLKASDANDLAVLLVPKKPGYEWEEASFYSSPVRGDEAWFIGRKKQWWVPVMSGVITEVRTDEIVVAALQDVRVGTSGAPLITERGIVGMIRKDALIGEGNQVSVLPLSRVRDNMLDWKYPWALEDALYRRRTLVGLSPFFGRVDKEAFIGGAGIFESFWPAESQWLYGGSAFIEVGAALWEQELRHATLPGATPSTRTKNLTFGFADAGLRTYWRAGENWHPHVGGALGVPFIGDDEVQTRPFYTALAGVTYRNLKDRLGITAEVRSLFGLDVERRTVVFDPFGEATVSVEKRSAEGITMNLLFSYDFW